MVSLMWKELSIYSPCPFVIHRWLRMPWVTHRCTILNWSDTWVLRWHDVDLCKAFHRHNNTRTRQHKGFGSRRWHFTCNSKRTLAKEKLSNPITLLRRRLCTTPLRQASAVHADTKLFHNGINIPNNNTKPSLQLR